jgi:hypothetical protein
METKLKDIIMEIKKIIIAVEEEKASTCKTPKE